MRRRVIAVTASAAALAAGWTVLLAAGASASAAGDVTVVVRGVGLPATGRTQIAVVGCADVFTHSPVLAPAMMGLGPRPAPAGARSLAFAPASGDAVGPLTYLDRVAATSVAQMSVLPRTDGAGVAYVGYQAPTDAGTSTMWIGRADVALAGGRWSTLDATGLTYTWTRYDMATQLPVGVDPAPAPTTVASFVREQGGDGYGFYALGAGCDGGEFNTDSWRIGSPGAITTYDFEGYPTATSIAGPGASVHPGTPVTLTGEVRDATGAPLEGWAVLERRGPDGWTVVDGADATGSTLTATVAPEETTTYRWRLVDRARYEGSVSAPITVQVERPQPSPDPSSPDPSSPDPSSAGPSTPDPSTPDPSTSEPSVSGPSASTTGSPAEPSSVAPEGGPATATP